MSDFTLKCNALSCRRPVTSRAVATTCSHLFCVDCATASFSQALVCPACESSLTELDSIVFVELQPSEEWKSSILAALKPETILDIASRALSFYTYQQTQEYAYLQITYRQLEERLSESDRRLSGVVREANAEINQLREKLSAYEKDYELEKRKSLDVAEQLQEKTRQLQRLQKVYDALKRKTLLHQPSFAAGDGTLGAGPGSNEPRQFGGAFGIGDQNANNGRHGASRQHQASFGQRGLGLGSAEDPGGQMFNDTPAARQQPIGAPRFPGGGFGNQGRSNGGHGGGQQRNFSFRTPGGTGAAAAQGGQRQFPSFGGGSFGAFGVSNRSA
ncbi:hypothetical protein DFJ74DRAFT_671764 [Hyaloraphidium curvatum]|nr:hypothetical protein DFJ74DRAFT_671764 [Hyaloraphidium curvatum]